MQQNPIWDVKYGLLLHFGRISYIFSFKYDRYIHCVEGPTGMWLIEVKTAAIYMSGPL